ncbi:hypothetical protein [Microtetraspora niveoalba]|uniref:hypothetical protein n=1 Tax=Microtetraspora niveoalba TaxID=46175 RepID=UPI0008317E35|nr:hypothetical protein [Microtetraspora niveoalba]
MSDQFPVKQGRIIRAMQRDIERLSTLAKTVAPTPVTKSSGAFHVPSTAAPDAPASGFKIYSDGGNFRIRNSNGTVRGFPGSNVFDHSMTSSTIGSAPTASDYNRLRTDVANLSQTVNNLLSSLRSVGLIG